MLVTFENDLYIARGYDTFTRKDYLKANGFIWNPEIKAWVAEFRPDDRFLFYWADDELFETVNYKFTTNNIQGIEVEGALPHQGVGVNFLMTKKRCLLADDQGLGKTFTCIKAFEMLGLQNILVICPLIAVTNWKNEILRFSDREDIVIANTKVNPKPGITIIHYDALSKKKQEIDNTAWDCIIVDECHKIKNKKADRSKQVYGVWDNKKRQWKIKKIVTEYAWFISGTPTTGNAYDLYPMLSYLDKERFGWAIFTKRYAYQGKFGYESYIGQNRLLREEMAATGIMLRREKSEAWKDMPKKNYKYYTSSISEYRLTREQKKIVEESKFDIDKVNSTDDLIIAEYSAMRKLVGLLKIDSSVEIALELLEDNEQLLIGVVHREVAEQIKARLSKEKISCELIYGGSKNRPEIIQAFQDGDLRVIVANIISAGTAINLYRCNNVLYAEKEWNHSDNVQFEDRIHRIGQEKPCYYHSNYVEGTVDEVIYGANNRKKSNSKRIMG